MNILIQVAIIFSICLAGEALSALIPLPVPAGVWGMLLLFALLQFKVIKVHHIRLKADFLLQNMAFFFIPAGVGIMTDFGLIQSQLFQLLIVCIVSTICTFAAAGFTAKGIMALQRKFERRGSENNDH